MRISVPSPFRADVVVGPRAAGQSRLVWALARSSLSGVLFAQWVCDGPAGSRCALPGSMIDSRCGPWRSSPRFAVVWGALMLSSGRGANRPVRLSHASTVAQPGRSWPRWRASLGGTRLAGLRLPVVHRLYAAFFYPSPPSAAYWRRAGSCISALPLHGPRDRSNLARECSWASCRSTALSAASWSRCETPVAGGHPHGLATRGPPAPHGAGAGLGYGGGGVGCDAWRRAVAGAHLPRGIFALVSSEAGRPVWAPTTAAIVPTREGERVTVASGAGRHDEHGRSRPATNHELVPGCLLIACGAGEGIGAARSSTAIRGAYAWRHRVAAPCGLALWGRRDRRRQPKASCSRPVGRDRLPTDFLPHRHFLANRPMSSPRSGSSRGG